MKPAVKPDPVEETTIYLRARSRPMTPSTMRAGIGASEETSRFDHSSALEYQQPARWS